MANLLQDLRADFPIVDSETGQPTDYFLRLLRDSNTINADTQTTAVQAETTSTANAAEIATLTAEIAALKNNNMIAGFISSPADKDYRLVVKMAHSGTIVETTTVCTAGTATATFKVNATPLSGAANAVSTSENSQLHSSSFAAGDDIVLTISATAACEDLTFAINYIRTS